MKKCIYCLNEFTEAPPEHLFPEAFGCTREYFLDCVCFECNQKLGNELINNMSYNSIDAIYKCQVSKKKKLESRKRNRLEAQISDSHPHGNFKNALQYFGESGPPEVHAQIKVGRKRILLEDIHKNIKFLEAERDKKTQFEIISRNQEEQATVIKALKSIGITLTLGKEEKLTEPPVSIVSMVIDSEVKRFYNYLAFNYLSYNICPEYMMNNKFDNLREFIINGTPLKEDNFYPVRKIDIHPNFTLPDNPYHIFSYKLNSEKRMNILIALYGINKPTYLLDFGEIPIFIKGKMDIYDINRKKFIS